MPRLAFIAITWALVRKVAPNYATVMLFVYLFLDHLHMCFSYLGIWS
jgi:hypothetical protein